MFYQPFQLSFVPLLVPLVTNPLHFAAGKHHLSKITSFCTIYDVERKRSNDVLASLVIMLCQFWHKYKKRTHSAFSFWFRQRPTFPGSFPPSIIGTTELNFRVRDGNGCDLCVITTEYLISMHNFRSCTLKIE